MAYHPRIETSEYGVLLTTRSRNSELWFVNNDRLGEVILGYTARYQKRYSPKLYALAIEGNHIHGVAEFPNLNRSCFMRDLNSSVARAVARHVVNYPGGKFWGRRYSNEFIPGGEDIENEFFYTVLQPVQDGLVEKISEFPGYNCFHDAVWGIEREYKVVRWAEYNAAKRYKQVSIKDYTDIVTLKYERLPGYEELSQKDYAHLMMKKLEERRAEIVKERYAEGKGFMGKDQLLRVRPGSLPIKTKTSTRFSHRPRVLSVCNKRRNECKAWYFRVLKEYRISSYLYRTGQYDVAFPCGTYKPYLAVSPPAG